MQQPLLKQGWVSGAAAGPGSARGMCEKWGPPMHCAVQVFVLWPDDGSWYKGRVTECDVDNAKATIYYDETEETEECDLKELIGDGQIAFSEWGRAGGGSGAGRGALPAAAVLDGSTVSVPLLLHHWACQEQGSPPSSCTAAARPH